MAPVPQSDRSFGSANQIAYFLGRVELEKIPPGLRPGMTAEISILSERHRDVLTVPSTAVKKEEGREICYVNHHDNLERRPVTVIPASHDLTEVVDGLAEGERVVLDPIVDSGAAKRPSGIGTGWEPRTDIHSRSMPD